MHRHGLDTDKGHTGVYLESKQTTTESVRVALMIWEHRKSCCDIAGFLMGGFKSSLKLSSNNIAGSIIKEIHLHTFWKLSYLSILNIDISGITFLNIF